PLPADVTSRPDHASLLELNAILLKACATDRRERYQSADQMRANLELLVAGHSVKRRQAWQQGLKHAKKFASTIGAMAIVAAIAYWLVISRSRSSDTAQSRFVSSTNGLANEDFL